MAQTKRKRQTKHRGNAAGIVESRGRTSRPPSPSERKAAEKAATRSERLMKKPTWRSSWMKSAFAGVFMFVFLSLFSHPKHGSAFVSAIFPAAIAFLLFGPANYYLELHLWKRRQNPPAPRAGGSGGLFGGFGRKK
jgi:hypothetical protein